MALALSIILALLLLDRSALGFRLPLAYVAGGRSRWFDSVTTLKLRGDSDVAVKINDHTDAGPSLCSRRRLLGRALSASVVAPSLVFTIPAVASAKIVAMPSAAAPPAGSTPERDALLRAIAGKSSDEAVLRAIQNLVPLSPLKGDKNGRASYASALDGQWRLLWYNTSGFSPLLKLPAPFRPDSYQYFGAAAEAEVGEGRVAQGLAGGALTTLGPRTELWLSSGAVAREGHPSTLDIYPPFRFQLGELPGSPKPKRTVVEAGSDAEFRAANARSREAQLAPKNEYEQLYLEDIGAGSLRVSTVAAGDPVIVGEMFVHQKL